MPRDIWIRETCYPSEGSAVSAVTYGELSGWVTAAKGEGEPSLAGYVTEAAGKKAGKAVDKAEFWEFYDAFLGPLQIRMGM